MKLLLTKGILSTHPPICDCEGCRMSSPVVSNKSLTNTTSIITLSRAKRKSTIKTTEVLHHQLKAECCNVSQAAIPEKSQGLVHPRFASLFLFTCLSLSVCLSWVKSLGPNVREPAGSAPWSVSVVITFPELSAWSPSWPALPPASC